MFDVLAIDPGEKAGVAQGRIDDDRGSLEVVGHWIMPLWTCADYVWTNIHTFDVLIYERWRLNAAVAKSLIGNDMQTSQLIGVIRFLARRAHVKLVSQDPKDQVIGERCAPPTIKDILATLPKAHDESHDGSALKHLAYYWYRHYFHPAGRAL